MLRFVAFGILVLANVAQAFSQGCCSGGSGSPIAGGASHGVLLDRQVELALNYQSVFSNRFMTGDSVVPKQLESFNSRYLYFRAGYGVTKDFTMAVESGYFLNKTQIGLEHADTVTSSGIGDLILFPRYTVLNRNREKTRTEITLGLGFKIPLGRYNDSTLVYTNPVSGKEIYTTSPPTIQPTTGANDVIFYGFAYRGYPKRNVRIFANTLFIHKGWNPLGQRFGDYASVGLFAGKTFFDKLGLTMQLRGEWIDKMQHDKHIDMLALYNIDVASTGSRKLFAVPQVNFTFKDFTLFALTELPLYQHLNGTQIASDVQMTCGVSFRFFTYKSATSEKNGKVFACPMHPEETSARRAKCTKCGMDLERK